MPFGPLILPSITLKRGDKKGGIKVNENEKNEEEKTRVNTWL